MTKPLSRREFLKDAALAPLVLTLLGEGRGLFAEGARRPNIILFTSDDHSYGDLGCFGNPHVQTPNLDRFASEGALFTQMYSPSAVCMPARAAIMTGLYPHTSGGYRFGPLVKGTPTLVALLKQAGYFTGVIGKCHLDPKELYPFDYVWTTPNWGGAPTHEPEPFGEHMKEFLAAAGDKPFLLYANSSDPHRRWPNEGQGRGVRMVMGKKSPHTMDKVVVPGNLPDIPEVREDLVCYYDAIWQLDATFGAVWDELVNSKRADDTLTMFMGDNGIGLPMAKTTVYLAGVHLPFILRWPGVVKPGSRVDAKCSFIDIAPTCLDAAGAPVPRTMQGRSFLPLLQGKTTKHRDEIFVSHTDHAVSSYPARGIITDRWQYIYNLRPEVKFESDARGSKTFRTMVKLSENDPAMAERVKAYHYRPREELYDIQADPWEQKNLAGKPEHAKVQKELYDRLRAKMTEIKDPWLNRMKPLGT